MFLLSKELQVWLFLQPFQHNPTPRPQRPGLTQLTRQPVQVWGHVSTHGGRLACSARRLPPEPPGASARGPRRLPGDAPVRFELGPVQSPPSAPTQTLTGALQGGRGPRRLLPVRSATPGSGSSRAARRRRLGGCDKRRHSSSGSHLGTSGSGGRGLRSADVSDRDVSARHAPRRGPRDAPPLPHPVPPHSHGPALSPAPVLHGPPLGPAPSLPHPVPPHSHGPAPHPRPPLSTAHPRGPAPRPPARSGARAPLWDVVRVMLALSSGLFWPEDVRRVGSLPAYPRKGSVLNASRYPSRERLPGCSENRRGALAQARSSRPAVGLPKPETGGRPPSMRRPPPWAARARLAAARGLPSYRPGLLGLPDLPRHLVPAHR